MPKLSRSQYRQAILQAREAGTLPVSSRRRREVVDHSEASRVRSNQGKSLIRKTKRKLRSRKRHEIWERYRNGEDISRVSWSYEVGDLVMNTTLSHGVRTPESCGLIVETDTDRRSGTHRILKVMCGTGVEEWDASKCVPVPPDEDE